MMKDISITCTSDEAEKLITLIRELDSYYDYDAEFRNRTEEWDFEDVDAQREIAVEIANVLRDKFTTNAQIEEHKKTLR